jgi:alcohol dehydrogenase
MVEAARRLIAGEPTSTVVQDHRVRLDRLFTTRRRTIRLNVMLTVRSSAANSFWRGGGERRPDKALHDAVECSRDFPISAEVPAHGRVGQINDDEEHFRCLASSHRLQVRDQTANVLVPACLVRFSHTAVLRGPGSGLEGAEPCQQHPGVTRVGTAPGHSPPTESRRRGHRLIGEELVQLGVETLHSSVPDGGEQRGAIGEPVIDGAAGHPRFPDHAGDGDRVHAPIREQPHGCVEDRRRVVDAAWHGLKIPNAFSRVASLERFIYSVPGDPMQSLVLTGPRGLEWQDRPAPRLSAPLDALVRPIASAACDLDRRLVKSPSPFRTPFALGHEAVGEIVDLADDDSPLHVGQRVVIPWHISCGTCENCRRDLPGACVSVPRLASYGTSIGGHWGGLFDDLVRVPWARHNLTPLPPTVDPFLAASAADNLTDAFQAVRPTLATHPDAEVLVVGGTASLGLLTVLSAIALKAGKVTYLDIDEHRCASAVAAGAAVTATSSYPDRLDGNFDLVVDASASTAGFSCALLSTRPGGTCVVRSIYFTELRLPYFALYATGVNLLIGPPHASPHVPDVLRLVDDGTLDPSPALAGPFNYDDAVEILLDPPPAKPVFVRDERRTP